MQLSEGIEGFIRFLKFEKRNSPHTVISYEKDLLQFRDYLLLDYDGLADIVAINHHHIRSWLASIKAAQNDVKATTLNHKISSLGSFYKYAMREGSAERNPVKMLHSLKKPERLPVSLQESQTKNLMEEISFGEGFKGFTDRLICELLYSTGMRRQELLMLRERDIAWGTRLVRVLGKGNKERMIPVSEALADEMREYIAAKRRLLARPDREFLLVLVSGRPLYAGYVYRVVKDHLAQVTTQTKRSPHVLRHTFATQLLNNGANIQAIKELLGHSSLAATQIYTHTDIERLKEIHKAAHPRENGNS